MTTDPRARVHSGRLDSRATGRTRGGSIAWSAMNTFTAGEGVERSVREWVFSDRLRELVAIFGETIPATDTREVLAWLDEFSLRRWDFRGGRERSAMRHHEFTAGESAAIMATMHDLGLAGRTTPARDSYDRILILGGGAPACVIRPAYAASLAVTSGGVAALGSDRPLREAERRFLADIGAPGPETEADAIDLGARAAFGDEPAVTVVCALRGDGSSRANTADTYEAWRAADPADLDRVLIVTTDIYVPFQHFDAVRKIGLALNCSVETIGVPAGYELPSGYRVRFTLSHYLQEVRSAIRSLRRLLAAVDGDVAMADSR